MKIFLFDYRRNTYLHEEGAVLPSLGDTLGTAEVDVNRITVVFYHASCLQKDFRVMARNLHDQRSITLSCLEVLFAVVWIPYHAV